MALEIIESSKTKQAWSTKTCIIVAIFSLLIGLAIFAFAYISVSQHTYIDNLNQPILSWMLDHRSPQITPIISSVTSAAGSLYLSAIVSVIAIIWAISKREFWRPILLVGAVGFCSVVSTVIKSLVHNARPLAANMIQPLELDYSFPSGHTLATVVFVLVFGYLIISRRSSGFRIVIWFIMSIALTAVIAFSRLYLGYHWLTDVTASIGVGLVIFALVVFADKIFTSLYKN